MTTRAMTFYETTIGKKVVMAITGLVGFGFLLGHMSGNLLVFAGADKFNAYAAFLKNSGALLWGTRGALIASVILHVHAAMSLWQRNADARPRAYYQRQDLATNYAAKTMRYGGMFLFCFIVFHILHLTIGLTGVMGYEFSEHNAYNNLVYGMQIPAVAAFYVLAMCALGMHLYHGVWSLTQTLGLEHPKYNRLRQLASAGAAAVVVLGFVSIPISVQTGALTPTEDLAEDAVALVAE
jgi:succinate dehydrogenase / fumarate reductase cytochrome b subunit